MENLSSSPLLYGLALTLIHFIWQGALVALALKFLLTITPYQKAQLRYFWSALAMIISLIVPIITFYIVFQPEYIQQYTQLSNTMLLSQSTELQQSSSTVWYQELIETLPYVSLLWLTTVSMLASKLFIELYNVNQLAKTDTIPANDALVKRFETLVERIQLTKTPRLLISLRTKVPMAIGWLKPVVLIPASMLTGLTPAQLDMLILHELAHIRRHDYFVNFLQTLVETLLFFHPGVRWISKQMRNEREYCSDDIAVKISGNPIAYAHTLADTASLCKKHRHHSIPSMAMAASGGDLKQRVVRLVDQNHHCSSSDDSGKFLASVLIIVSILAVAIKPYLNSPIIDFNTGRILLFQTASEFIKQKPSREVSFSKTSIAQQLLQSESNSTVLSSSENRDIITQTKAEEESTPLQAKASVIVDKSIIGNNMVSSPALPVVANVPTNNKAAYAEDLLIEQEETIESVLAINNEKSLAELAFERTDSLNSTSKMSNPYSKQVASLSNEDIAIDVPENTANIMVPTVNEKSLILPLPKIIQQSVAKPKAIVKTKAELLSSFEPRYPSTAKRKGLELDVAINFIIDKNGKVKNIEFEQKSKVSYFRSAIRSAMEKWRFLPAKVDGQPIESNMSKIFAFSLMK